MLLLPTSVLKPGMALARHVLHPDRADLLLLARGYVLDTGTITHLRSNFISHVWIDFPALDELQGRISEDIAQSHMELFKVLSGSIERLEPRVSLSVNVQKYRKAVHHMLADIVEHSNHDIITNQLRLCGNRLAGHQANCAYLALLIGAHLSGYVRTQRNKLPTDVAENTAQLGLGALLHDVGKATMPDDIRHITALDSESLCEEYRCHTRSGYETIRDHISPVAAHVVLHHHQRYNGSGFPLRATRANPNPEPLSGSRIHIFSRIVGAIDAFDHLLCPTDPAAPKPTIVALSHLRSHRFRGWFDPVVIEAMTRLVPPFMVGQSIRLNDGQQAIVTENHQDTPTQPTIRTYTGLLAGSDMHMAPRSLDLRMARGLYIAQADGYDVTKEVLGPSMNGPQAAA